MNDIIKKPNYFITVEGIEGAGKSSMVRFIHQWLTEREITHLVTREPGGTEIAEDIRHLLLRHHQEKMAVDTELLLMFASRAQHIDQVIRPALGAGQWVLCDRFTDATYAYQGGGRGIPKSRIAQIERWVQGDLRPDYVILLDVPAHVGLRRIQRRAADRIEQEKVQFFERVRQSYRQRALADPARYKLFAANQSLSRLKGQVRDFLSALL